MAESNITPLPVTAAAAVPVTPPPVSVPTSASSSSWWSDLLSSNPVFSGGAGLAVLGLAAALGRELLRTGTKLGRKYCTVSMEIASKDRSYQWVLQYLSKPYQQPQSNTFNADNSSVIQTPHAASARSPSRFLSLIQALSVQQHLGVETSFSQSPSGVISTHFDFVPSPGEHTFWYKGHLIHYERSREKSMVDLQTGSPWETVTLRMLGRNKQIMLDLLQSAKAAALKKTENKTIIYTSSGIDWRAFGQPRKKRPFNSVILDLGIAEKLLADFTEFLNSQQWYVDRGIPYRRGYLLHGPPGCGKSSFIQALAGHMQYNICVLNLNERSLTDDKLAYLFSTIPPRSVLLLEDVDAAFTTQRAAANVQTLTFSGLLNALDGVASTEERIIFMTTNHHERLDPALIRPGRVDVQQYIGMASAHQLTLMFQRFYPQASQQLCEQFVAELKHVEVSIAELQGFFLLNKGNAQAAVQMSVDWRKFKERIAVSSQHKGSVQQPSTTAASTSHSSSSSSSSSSSTSESQRLQDGLAQEIASRAPPSPSFIMSKE